MKDNLCALRLGTTLVITLVTISALSLMAAGAARRILPRLPLAYQNAAWEEARAAADAGIDMAMNDLIKNVAGPDSNFWVAWRQNAKPGSGPPTSAPPPAAPNEKNVLPKTPKASAPPPPAIPLLSLLLPPPKPKPKDKAKAVPPAPVVQTAPIYVNNLRMSAAASIPTEVDIKLWALNATAGTYNPWFRIRSIGTCGLPPVAYRAPEPLDATFRRLSLRNVRPSLANDREGNPGTVALPNVSRVVEVLVEPIRPFELALWSVHSLKLSMFGGWLVDSYDSSDPAKSNAGAYPGRVSPAVQSNGDIACSQLRPPDDLYGPLISANGSTVYGAVATNGGDDPGTPQHENVFAPDGLDQTRIRNDFSRVMNPVRLPEGGAIQPPPANGIYVAGPPDAPKQYLLTGRVTSLRIKGPGQGQSGLIILVIDGDLMPSGPLIIPPTVTAVFYVRGEISFINNVNSGPWNSNLPAHLLIFGETDGVAHQRLSAHGNISVCASFYGPKCDITLDGTVDWCGSLAGYDFAVTGSGNGGIHYDESLGLLGPPISFRIVRYIEDVRE